MKTDALYDDIGRGYRGFRVPDPRIAMAIQDALGDCTSVVNVGAGAGSYEPADRDVVAVEISRTMIAQRRGAVPVLQGSAEALPFEEDALDASLAILTLHHWADREAGLREMARVARRRVIVLTWEPDAADFWLSRDYFPELLELDRAVFPPIERYTDVLGPCGVAVVPIPADCSDGFLGAYWQRPEAYLDDAARGAMSTFTKLADVEKGLGRLRSHLEDGTWERRYGHLRDMAEIDLGYRLVVAEQRA